MSSINPEILEDSAEYENSQEEEFDEGKSYVSRMSKKSKAMSVKSGKSRYLEM